MRIARFIGTSTLFMLLAGSVSVYAQDRQEQKESPEPKPETSVPAGKSPEEMKAPKQDEAKPGKQEEEKRNQDSSARQEEMKNDKGKNNNKSGKPADRNTQEAKQSGSNGNHGRIPDDKFRAHFGRQHTFSVHTTTVGGRPQFQYGGYAFNIVEVWPVDWAYTNDCYVDYIDGEYFLFNLRHPGVRLALVVVL